MISNKETLMYINVNEFESAFIEVQKAYPKISRQLAESFISKLGDLVEKNRVPKVRENFGELLRRALNDSHVWKRVDREPYKVLAGKFFGRRGACVSHRQPRGKMVSKPPQTTDLSYPVSENPKGQLTWVL